MAKAMQLLLAAMVAGVLAATAAQGRYMGVQPSSWAQGYQQNLQDAEGGYGGGAGGYGGAGGGYGGAAGGAAGGGGGPGAGFAGAQPGGTAGGSAFGFYRPPFFGYGGYPYFRGPFGYGGGFW